MYFQKLRMIVSLLYDIFMKSHTKVIFSLFLAIFLAIFGVAWINLSITSFAKNLEYRWEEKMFWIVLWARVRGQTPSDVLKDRLDSAFELYTQKKIQKILVTGDNSTKGYDETTVMQQYLVTKWVPQWDIFMDFAWFDTYDSLYRAKYIFSIVDAIVFTQQFHLARSVYIWKKLGIDVVWYPSDKHTYVKIESFMTREIFARVKAFFDVQIFHSKPKFLGDKVRG